MAAASGAGSVAFYATGFESGNLATEAIMWYSGGATIVASDAFEGTYSLKALYPVTGGDVSPERRFSLGRGVTRFWLTYKLKVAAGFTHQTGQYKALMFWHTTHGSGNPGLQWGGEIWRVSDAASRFRPLGTISMTDAASGNGFYVYGLDEFGGTFPNGSTFISASGPVIPGTYADLKFDIKPASAIDAMDGHYKLWVNNALYFSFSGNLYSKNVEPILAPEVFNGYFMGYKNNAMTSETAFYIDNVKMFDVDPVWGL